MGTWLSWIGDERIAISGVPTASTLDSLRGNGVTHIVNCRATVQTWLTRDLVAERALLGRDRVVHAPMWDLGRPQPPRLWSAAALYAARVLADDPDAGLLVHCHKGRRRSVMLAYAVLRLRGHASDDAIGLIVRHRTEAIPVDVYVACVERWLASGAPPVGRLRIRLGRTG